MARIRIAGTSGASENTIVFSPAGGHSHNGQNSSLIDSTAYSVYDFSPTFVGTEVNPDRAVRQENNRIAFEDLIKRVVNNSVLAPAGIRLEQGSLNGSLIIANTITANQLAANTITAAEIFANTITADQIAANTITADELVSNIVLVNNIIRSNVFTSGSAGWRISNDGTAEFSNVVVRGNIFSNVGTIGGWTLSNTSINSGSTYLYSNGQITNGGFTLSSAGVLTATGANINGIITSTSGTIGGWTISSNTITAGSTTLASTGAATFGNTVIASNGQITNGGYTLSNTGSLTATSGTITGLLVRTAASGGRAEFSSGGIQLFNASDAKVYSFSQDPTHGGSALFTSWASIGPNDQTNTTWLYDNVIISGTPVPDIVCHGRLFIGGSETNHTVGYGLSIEKYAGYTSKPYAGMSIGPTSHYGVNDYSFLIHDTLGITLINARDDSATYPFHGVQIRLGDVPHTTFSPNWLTTHSRGIDSGGYYTKADQFIAPGIYQSTGSYVFYAQWYYDAGVYKLGFTYSNRDAKQDIADMPDMLPLIAKLKPRTFRWKSSENAEVYDPTANYLHKSAKVTNNGTVSTYPDGEYEKGFIVEEVLECGHDLVSWHPTSDEPKPMMWKANDFIAIAIKGIQELKSQVDDLSAKVKELESAIG